MFVFLVVIVDLITLLFDTKILKVKNRDDELVAMLVVLMSKAILVMIILLLRKFVAARQDSFQRQTNMLRYAIIPFVSICTVRYFSFSPIVLDTQIADEFANT